VRKVLPGLLILASLLMSAAVYTRLPSRMATHWNLHGEPDGWSGRASGAFLLPAVMLAVWGLAQLLPVIDPRRANYAKFRATYDLVIAVIVGEMALLHVAIVGSAIGWPIAMPRVAPIGVALVLVVIGNTLPRARPNWFFGIRTPWTLSSDRVWERTHRLGGYLMMVSGGLIALAAVVSPRWAGTVLAGTLGLTTFVALVYSYVLWRRESGG
jgi:uncharacterized membrane protein